MIEIIAEIGINHNGSMSLAHELIRQASMSGASVAKFQAYDVDKLFHPETGEDPNEEIWRGVKPLEFNKEQFAKINDWCEEEGIEFMCSVFDEKRLSWMEDLGVKKHKIASRVSKLNRPLAQKIIDTGKECYMSLGFDSKAFPHHIDNVRYMYCVSEYPAEYKSVRMPKSFGTNDTYQGFSDHTLGIGTALVAIGRGARVIEKHFTLNKAAEGFDHVCSIDPFELNDLVIYAREMEKVL